MRHLKIGKLHDIVPVTLASLLALSFSAAIGAAQDYPKGTQIVLKSEMVTPAGKYSFDGMIDEQDAGKNPTLYASKTFLEQPWPSSGAYPLEFTIDLGSEKHLSHILLWDSNGNGKVTVLTGDPATGQWQELFTDTGDKYQEWSIHKGLDRKARYLKVTKESDAGIFGEMLVFEHTPETAKAEAEAKAAAAQLTADLDKAKAEAAKRPLVETGTLFGKLPLVDSVDPSTNSGHTLIQLPENGSTVEKVLGRSVRALPNTHEGPSYFGYKLGEGKYLEPGKAYLLTVEFPEDAPRSFYVANRGGDLIRGVHTGPTLADSIFGYTDCNLESLNIPLSGKFETFQQLFWLSEHQAGVEMPREEGERSFSPLGGFLVMVGQWPARQAPLSKGAAVASIKLFEVPDPAKFNVALKRPPAELPQRHLFYREEMGDGVMYSGDPKKRAFTKFEDWFLPHFKLLNFLGMDTFTKDLLEFGHVQHWDVENPNWYTASWFPEVWEKLIPLANEHGLNILPYYEYAGSTGKQGIGQKGAELAQPLRKDLKDYTHIWWSEKNRVDVSDPEVTEEFKRVLDLTIVKFKDQAHFIGAWIRPRISQIPVSFSDSTRERFAKEANDGKAISREDIQANQELHDRYIAWWNGKRKAFLIAVRDYLKEKGVTENPLVLYMAESSEPVPTLKKPMGIQITLATDNVDLWNEVKSTRKDYENFLVMDESVIGSEHLYKEALEAPTFTWGGWEWQYGGPRPDPQNYKDTTGILMTYPFNRKYTVNDPEALESFRGPSGLAMIRHYILNEEILDKVTGYFVCDVDRPGPYGMLSEVLAMANGDPNFIGYASGHIYNRPFPDAVRAFNANFLALPALPSKVVANAASDQEVVVRQIDTPAHGSYLAVINTGLEGKKQVKVKLPKGGKIIEAATGNVLTASGNVLTLDMGPVELKSLHIQ
jgi:hypothetical protein